MNKQSMKLKKRVLALVMVAAMVIGCTVTGSAATTYYAKSLTLSKTTVSVTAGKSTTVKATEKIVNKKGKSVIAKFKGKDIVSVKSSDTKVATVKVGKANSKGVATVTIKGVKAGKATITVTTKNKTTKKKYIKKTVKVTVKPKPVPAVASITLDKTAVTVAPGGKATLKATVAPSNAPQTVTWTSSNTSVATVSNGVVTGGNVEGTAVITAKAGTQTATCTVTNYRPFTKADYTAVQGPDKTVHIDFTAKSEEIANLYKGKPGYTVDGKNVTADIPCETYKYTFKYLPRNLNELKQISLDNPCAPMAATICAFSTVDTSMPSSTFATAKTNTLLPMLNYIGGPNCNLLDTTKTSPELHAQFLADRFFPGRGGSKYLTSCYFDGATPYNEYTVPPREPYSFTMYVGPYYIDQHTMLDGTIRPQTYMVLIKMEGDDSERYIDVYKSSRDGNWYALNSSPFETFKQLVAKPKDVVAGSVW